MKKNFALGWLAVSILTLASCSKEQTANKATVPDGTPATAKITLSLQGAQSYAADADTNGRPEESKITNATLYVFSNKTLASIVAFDGATDSKTFQTTTGPKQLFACVNMNGKIPAGVTVGMELDVFKKQIATAAAIADLATDNNFWMTNLEKDAPITNVVSATEAEVTGGTANNFTINVGRACAKVNLDLSGSVTQDGGILSAIEYKVGNNPKQMYLMPVYDGVNYSGSQLLSPYYSFMWKTPAGAGEVDKGSYFFTDYKKLADADHSSYLMENSNNPVLKGKAAYLLVKGTWAPKADQILNADGTEGGTLTAGTFWRIANYDKTATDPTAKIIGYEPKVYAATPTTLTASQKAIEYLAGTCYYAIWTADNRLTSAALKYTVKRNTYFKVVIDNVSGPGSSTEDGVISDPTDPVEADVNMKATINVVAWSVVNQNTGI